MMRRIMIGIIAGLLYLQPVSFIFADDSQSIIEVIVSNPGQYDGKVVTVEGGSGKSTSYKIILRRSLHAF